VNRIGRVPLVAVPRLADTGTCDRCEGTGWDYSEGPATRCVCMAERDRAAARQRLLEKIPMSYRECTRDSWRGSWPPAAPAAGARWWDSSWAVFVHGSSTGVGKTHLATALFLEAFDVGGFISCRWLSTKALLAAVTGEIAAKAERRIEREAREAQLLLLDDLGAERATDFAREVLSALLCHRYDWQRPTIVTSNAEDLAAIDALDPRLSSRLAHHSLLVHRHGEDRRIPT